MKIIGYCYLCQRSASIVFSQYKVKRNGRAWLQTLSYPTCLPIVKNVVIYM
jgi:hypothetical protein